MFSIIETIATTILLLILMMFVIHLIRGDAVDWLTSKFQIESLENLIPDTGAGTGTTNQSPPPIGDNA